MNPQVLIAGAGPVGLTLAIELARYGIAVRILDKAAQRTDKSKALVLWSRTLELLEQQGIAARFVTAGHKVLAANIIAGATQIGHVGLEDVRSPYAFALMLPQSDTERLLEDRLCELGVRVERSVELAGFTEDGTGVVATLRDATGGPSTVRADWLVGCDGAHSTVRHALRMPFEGETLQSDWILADVHLQGLPVPDTEMATYWHQDGVLVFFPISPGRYRIIADLGRSDGPLPADPSLAEVQAIVDRRGPGHVSLSDPIWLSSFRINERKVAAYRAGRVFLAGDAAHVHSPAGGQGMNTGMQDAFNLAWKLALVCRGTCAEAPLLDSYSQERSAVGAAVLANAGRLTAAAVMRNRAGQAVRNLVGSVLLGLSPVRHAISDMLAEVSIGYPESPLTRQGLHGLHGPAPGARVPPADWRPAPAPGREPRFTLFAASSDAALRILDTHAALLAPRLQTPFDARGMWLVRPDGYVAVAAEIAHAADIGRYLDDLRPAG